MTDFWNLIVQSNTFNFAILAIIIAIVCIKIDLPNIIEKIRDEIALAIENANYEKQTAEKELRKTKKIVKNTDLEVNEKIDHAKKSAKLISDEIKKNTELSIQHIKDNIDRVIQAEEKKITAELTHNTIQSSVELAKKNIVDKLNNNIDLHNKFIEKSIQELDKIEL